MGSGKSNALTEWLSEHVTSVIYIVIIAIVLLLAGMASYKSTTLVKTDAVGLIDVSPEESNTTYNHKDADFAEYQDTGSFLAKSTRFELIGFSYNDKYYAAKTDCDTPLGSDKEDYDYVCRTNDDDQNYYIKISQYPNGLKPITTINHASNDY